VRFARGDVRAVHEAMTAAAGGKDLWVVGGGDLAGQFADAGLLDEIIVYLAPVTLGGGAPLLPRKLDLRLEELAQNKAFACARYSVVGQGSSCSWSEPGAGAWRTRSRCTRPYPSSTTTGGGEHGFTRG
jgi:dihydrofolate reductase